MTPPQSWIALLVDVVIAFIAVEFVVLSSRRRWRPSAVLTIAIALAPGAWLMMALRVSLAGAGWVWVAACLAASLPFHLADLWRRKL